MQYALIAIVLMVLCVFGLSCRKSPASSTPAKPADASTTVSSRKYLSRQDIEKQLAVIATSPPPKELAMGAMCYDIAGPPQRIDYVCPICGEKTLYVAEFFEDTIFTCPLNKDEMSKIQNLDALRRLAKTITQIDLTLDESQFCKRCEPYIEEPKLTLVIHYPNQPDAHRVGNFEEDDLMLLRAFLEGKQKYPGLRDNEIAVKYHIDRLEELLGVKLDDTE